MKCRHGNALEIAPTPSLHILPPTRQKVNCGTAPKSKSLTAVEKVLSRRWRVLKTDVSGGDLGAGLGGFVSTASPSRNFKVYRRISEVAPTIHER